MGIISQEKAAEIAGLTRTEFIFLLGKFGVSPFQYTVEEIKKELPIDLADPIIWTSTHLSL